MLKPNVHKDFSAFYDKVQYVAQKEWVYVCQTLEHRA